MDNLKQRVIHMIRVAKDPEERCEELIDIAEQLFIKRGYEETPVSDIVKKANVAQGTFYYHFKTKDDILNALVQRYIRELETMVKKNIENKEYNAIQKLVGIYIDIVNFGQSRKHLLNYLHEEKNARLHMKMEMQSYPALMPLLLKIIKQGVSEGLFNIKYPREAAGMIMVISHNIMGREFLELSSDKKKRAIESHFYLIERILGAKQRCFKKYLSKMGGFNDG
jgi:AcrR family transcriptional regulator